MCMENPEEMVGQFFGGIELELVREKDSITRPRVRPITMFPPSMRVEFPRKLREMFPIGTRFIATVKVCQKHQNGEVKGQSYLKAYDIAIVDGLLANEGLIATVKQGSISGLAYEYKWVTKS